MQIIRVKSFNVQKFASDWRARCVKLHSTP